MGFEDNNDIEKALHLDASDIQISYDLSAPKIIKDFHLEIEKKVIALPESLNETDGREFDIGEVHDYQHQPDVEMILLLMLIEENLKF